jgi:hypothetical protein
MGQVSFNRRKPSILSPAGARLLWEGNYFFVSKNITSKDRGRKSRGKVIPWGFENRKGEAIAPILQVLPEAADKKDKPNFRGRRRTEFGRVKK